MIGTTTYEEKGVVIDIIHYKHKEEHSNIQIEIHYKDKVFECASV